ncbi:MAG: archaetidylserine decarboxylase [Sinobacteraceae bacterium]|nr:archaetidylserine decarboxylase [Nevskiaceae bacterium]
MSDKDSPPRRSASTSRPIEPDFSAWAFAALQRGLPTRALSQVVHQLTQYRNPTIKHSLISSFMRSFDIDLSQALRERAADYVSFNDFFTRALKPGARPLEGDANSFNSPVDGTISQCGPITNGRIIQAKGRDYSVAELLADGESARVFNAGSFCTVYLAPHNYHRIHMPCDGELTRWTYIPGRLFSVNPATAANMPRLFARNERLVAHFSTAFGPLALVMVGALFVGSLETVWAGVVSPPHRHLGGPQRHRLETPLAFARGAEIGRFNMGSTVILLATQDALTWEAVSEPGRIVRVRQVLAKQRGQSS